jgi:hypothetical protein
LLWRWFRSRFGRWLWSGWRGRFGFRRWFGLFFDFLRWVSSDGGGSGGKGTRIHPSDVALWLFGFALGEIQDCSNEENVKSGDEDQVPPEMRIFHVSGLGLVRRGRL